MTGPFNRRRERPASKPTQMTYDGTNGAEIVDWARDGDLAPRFVDSRLGQPARIRLPLGDGQGDAWEVVPFGSTIYLDAAGGLELEPPAAEATEEEKPQDD